MSYADRLIPALEDLCAELTDAGVKASTDRPRMRVPGAWVRPDRVAEDTLGGTGVARVSVFLVCPAGGDLDVLRTLAGLLDLALTVVTPEEDVDLAVAVQVGDNALPGFRLVCDIDI